ncbi:MAG TPA: alpha/beta fold hydrolase [Vicinamibacteria bacterium]|nr:alpha/beta fold hydrolase [Vicinamibacteria bacterium]
MTGAMDGGSTPISWRAMGQGPAILLLNGGLMSIAAWEEIASPLQDGHRVVRCDFRGQLLSPGEPPADIAGHARDVAGVLEAAGVERAHVVGTSYGGFVAVALAAAFPSRVASLTIITSADRVTDAALGGLRELRTLALAVAEGAADGGAVFDHILPATFSDAFAERHRELIATRRAAVAGLPRAWFTGLAGLTHAIDGLDLGARLAHVRCPTLVVSAALDRTFPPERSRRLAARIPGARLVELTGVGHAAVLEAPGRIVDLVRGHVDAVEKARPGARA